VSKWEYAYIADWGNEREVRLPGGQARTYPEEVSIFEVVSTLGDEGWELTGIAPGNGEVTVGANQELWLKRPKES
jgi:hypothetical protein